MTTEDEYEAMNQKARKVALDYLEAVIKGEPRGAAGYRPEDNDRIAASHILLEFTGDLRGERG